MTLQINNLQSVQFGVCRGPISKGDAVEVPVDNSVQDLLVDMINQSAPSDDDLPKVIRQYEPAESHADGERLALPLDDPLVTRLRTLYERNNLPIRSDAMSTPESITSYFGIFHRQNGSKLMGIRRASQFKGVLKARLCRLLDDSLKAIPDKVFKLDADFDVLIDGTTVHILHPASFDQLAEIDEAVLAAAVAHAQELEQRCPDLGFSSLTEYISTHKRAARLIASIRRRDDLDQTAIAKFRRECQRSGIDVQLLDGKLSPAPKQELAFLEMLDRRRYVISLVNGKWERFAATGRKPVGIHQPLKTAAAAAGSARPRARSVKLPRLSPKI